MNNQLMRTYLTLFCLSIFILSNLNCRANADSVQYWSQKTQSKTDSIAAINNYKLGDWYARGGSKFDSALICLEKSLTYYSNKKNKSKIGDCNYLMGIAYARMKKNKKALTKFKIAEKQFEELKNTSKRIFAMEAQGFAFTPDQRIELYYKTLKLARSANLMSNEITILGNLARAYSNKGIVDSTIALLNQQYNMLQKKKNKEGETTEINTRLVYCTQSLGHAYYKKSNYPKSFEFNQIAYEYSKSIDPNFSAIASITASINFINFYWKKEDPAAHKKAYKNIDIIKLLREGQRVANRSQSMTMQTKVAESFTYYYGNLNNGDSALHYQELLLSLRDSANRTEQIKASAKFAEELKTADKEKEIIQLNADKKIASATANRNKIIFLLILISLLSSIYFIVKRIKQRNLIEQEERDKNFRSKLSSDLHDDVGTILTSLSMQSELLEMKASEGNKGTVSKIAGMSRDATRRMRDTVWAIDSRKDNIMDLAYRMIDFAEDILEPKDIEFQLEHNIENKEDKLSAELRQNIFLIFKEALANAAKYASGELVTSKLRKENEQLNLVISNQTDSEISVAEASGLGLSNIKKRAADLNGKCSIEHKDNSFNIKLSFPL